jgi:hypothetical protein
MKLQEVVSNPEAVTSVLDDWPDLHDAEILSLLLSRNGDVSLVLEVKVIPYNPSGTVPLAILTVEFSGIEELRIGFFNEQNVINDLAVERVGDGTKLTIESIYGLGGEFLFESARILTVKPLDSSNSS